MTTKKAPTPLSDLAESFDRLNLDEKAAFLLKAAFSTASTALEDIGERIDEMISSLGVPSDTEKEEADREHQDQPGSTSPGSESSPPS